MKIVLTDYSAFEFWRSEHAMFAEPSTERLGEDATANSSFVREAQLFGRYGLSEPLHLLVTTTNDRRHGTSVTSHCYGGELKANSLYKIEEGLFVIAPELSFLQMAHRLALPHAVQYGMELASSYSASSMDGRLYARAAFCNVDRLNKAALDFPFEKSRKADRALRWISDGSASPYETIVYLLLCLPQKYGGYGLPKPQLNHRVNLERAVSEMTGKDYLLCDFYWKERNLEVEYDSALHHSQPRQITNDALRRNALEFMGVRSITLTKEQVHDPELFDAFTRQLARMLGYRLRITSERFPAKRNDLRSLLFLDRLGSCKHAGKKSG